jgi:toxin YhaV
MSDRRRGSERRRGDRRTAAAPSVPSGHTVSTDAGSWTLLAHPCFLDQLERLTANAAAEPTGKGHEQGPATKLLGHVLDLVFDKIPQDPGNPAYRHGGALGGGNRHWFRAKTGGGRFRLFYRFSTSARIIVYGWLNDEQSLRTYGASTDAYAVFARMLDDGNPPSDWDELVTTASGAKAQTRLTAAAARQRSARKSGGRQK